MFYLVRVSRVRCTCQTEIPVTQFVVVTDLHIDGVLHSIQSISAVEPLVLDVFVIRLKSVFLC